MPSVIACGTTGYPGCSLDRVFAGLAKAGFIGPLLSLIPPSSLKFGRRRGEGEE